MTREQLVQHLRERFARVRADFPEAVAKMWTVDEDTFLRGHLKCGACKVCGYCSTTCQTAHWKGGHQQTCAGVKRAAAQTAARDA